MNKIYTKQGDNGRTKSITGVCISKDSCLNKINGAIDEVQSQLDKVIYSIGVFPTREIGRASCRERV